MQMAKTSVTSNKLHEKGIPYISILANPATGQAFASFGNAADIILAEPGAIVGYSPLRTVKESQENVTENAHTAESQLKHGMIDAVADRAKLKEIVSVLLDLLQKEFKLQKTGVRDETLRDSAPTGAWHSVQLARHTSRPTALDLLARMMDVFVELHVDRIYGDDQSVVCGLGHLGGQTVAVIGQEPHGATSIDGVDLTTEVQAQADGPLDLIGPGVVVAVVSGMAVGADLLRREPGLPAGFLDDIHHVIQG